MDLLLERVARQLDDLHAVAQRRRNGVELVGGGDEHDLREIVRHVEVVIGEAVVLLRIEHLEERRAGVAAEVGAQLVDLVEHHDRVHAPGLLHRLDDPSRQRAHVGAPVAADLRLVAHPAQREPDELAPRGLGDALPERGLADARGAHQAEDGALHVVLQLPHGQVLEDALLHLVQRVVVAVELLAGVLDVQVVVGLLRPGQVGDPLQVGARDRVLGRSGGDALEAVQLLVGDLLHLGRQAELLDPLAQLVQLLLLLAQLAQLLLDGLELLAQVVLALGLGHLALDLRIDLRAELEDLALAVQKLEDELHPLLQVDRLEDLLLLLDRDVHVGRDQVGQVARLGDALHQLGGGRRQLGHHLDDLAGELLQVDPESLDLHFLLRRLVLDRLDAGLEVRVLLHQLDHAEAGQPLHHERVVVLAHLEELHDPRDGAHRMQVRGARILLLRLALGDDADDLVVAHRVLDQRDGLLPADCQRQNAAGKEDAVAQRQDGEDLWDVFLVDETRRCRGHDLSLLRHR